jgi:hypothetical protein
MSMKVYDEIVEFLAAGTTPDDLLTFQPSGSAKARVVDLMNREKAGELSAEEISELDTYLKLEHLMRLTKAKARKHRQDGQ